MTNYEKECLLQKAMAKHAYNKAHPGKDNGDAVLAGITGMTISEGTFVNFCKAWLTSASPRIIERLFRDIYLIPFWEFIPMAIDRMPDEENGQPA